MDNSTGNDVHEDIGANQEEYDIKLQISLTDTFEKYVPPTTAEHSKRDLKFHEDELTVDQHTPWIIEWSKDDIRVESNSQIFLYFLFKVSCVTEGDVEGLAKRSNECYLVPEVYREILVKILFPILLQTEMRDRQKEYDKEWHQAGDAWMEKHPKRTKWQQSDVIKRQVVKMNPQDYKNWWQTCLVFQEFLKNIKDVGILCDDASSSIRKSKGNDDHVHGDDLLKSSFYITPPNAWRCPTLHRFLWREWKRLRAPHHHRRIGEVAFESFCKKIKQIAYEADIVRLCE